MSAIHIPPALDRHLVSAAHTAVTMGDFAAGAFEAVVEQVVRALREQGAVRHDIERALQDVFAGLSYAHQRSSVGSRYAVLESRALAIAEHATRRQLI